MKAAARDENAQKDIGAVIEYLRLLRDETGAAVCFVQHAGHQGEHMRGTSDLESVWETLLRWKREGQSPLIDVESEHREAEAGAPLRYQIGWDPETRTMRLDAVADTILDQIIAHLRDHPDSANKVFEAVGGNRSEVLAAVKKLRQQTGTKLGYHPGTTTPESPLAGGTPRALFRGLGTTTAMTGTHNRVPPVQDDDLEWACHS